MAKILFESRDRNEAHQFQAKVIADGSAPDASCTDHNERGTTIVWDGNLEPGDLDRLARMKVPQ